MRLSQHRGVHRRELWIAATATLAAGCLLLTSGPPAHAGGRLTSGPPAHAGGPTSAPGRSAVGATPASQGALPAGRPLPALETAGPIPTAAGSGPRTPTLPPTVAVLPGGVALHGHRPWVRATRLEEAGAPVRVLVRAYDASAGRGGEVAERDTDFAWQGELVRGWGRIDTELTPGHGYVLWVRDIAGGRWTYLGRFGVRGSVDTSGPQAEVGGMSADMATGELSWGWQSEDLAGPADGIGVALLWQARQQASPGLPPGWRLAAATGSAWASLEEGGSRGRGAPVPPTPVAYRADPTAPVTARTRANPSRSSTAGTALHVEGWDGSGWRRLAAGSAYEPLAVPPGITRVRSVSITGAVIQRSAVVPVLGDAAAAAHEGMLAAVRAERRSTLTLPTPTVPAPATASVGRCDTTVTDWDGPASVVLHGWNGATLTFLRNDSGVYVQAFGGDRVDGYRMTLSMCEPAQRTWLLSDASGVVTRFENGRAVSVTDGGLPTSTLTWSGGRLTSLTNGVGRTLTLTYAGSGACPSAAWSGFAAVPQGQLCRITYPGAVATDLGYIGSGLPTPQIALIKDPGDAGTTLGWDTVGRLSATRGTVATRAATVDSAARGVVARVDYDPRGRVSRLTEAPGRPGGPAVTQQLVLPEIAESHLRSGSPVTTEVRGTAAGHTMSNRATLDPVTHDSLTTTDRAGITTSTGQRGDELTTTDGRGLVTSFEYDDAENLISQSGPVRPGVDRTGTSATARYDTVRRNGEVRHYKGFRVAVYGSPGFRGAVLPDHWEPAERNGLGVRWSTGRAMSAVAEALWTPTREQERAARDSGWTVAIEHAPDADVRLLIEGVACEAVTCRFRDLPDGTKRVTLEVSRGAATGWAQVRVTPGTGRPVEVTPTLVRPGFANRTEVVSSDVYAGSESRPTVDLTFASPETAQVTRVDLPGGVHETLDYEPVRPAADQWGRLTRYVTPGGRVQTTSYWPNSGAVSLPAPCTGSAAASGQPRTVTRQDGLRVTTFHDARGRVIAVRTEGASGSLETACTRWFDDGEVREVAAYDSSGRLIESVRTERGVGADPLTSTEITTRGPAAPVGAGTTSHTTTTVDLRGFPVRYVDATGTVTATTYNALSEPTSVTVTAPGAGSPVLRLDYAYRDTDGALTSVTANGSPIAALTYTPATGAVQSIAYAGGAVTAALDYAATGAPEGLTVIGGGTRTTQRLEHTDYGRITGARLTVTRDRTTLLTETRAFTYDAGGRLVRALIVTTPAGAAAVRDDARYGYAPRQDAACSAAADYPRAAADALRTGGQRGAVGYVTCHDGQGRVRSTTDPLVTGDATGRATATIDHDGLGRVTAVRGAERPLRLTWGSGTALARLVEGTGDSTVTTTLTTAGTRVIRSEVDGPSGRSMARYAYSSPTAASPILTLDNRDTVSSVSYPLPGGARLDALRGAVPTLTLTGLDGAALTSVAVPGLVIAGVSGDDQPPVGTAARFGAYGEPLVPPRPGKARAIPVHAWQAGQEQQTLGGTSSITLMGARPYLPALGEFLAPDPDLDAGTNLYSYAAADPINGSDPTGASNGWSWFWQVIAALLVVASIVVGIATAGLATPATGSTISAWLGYLALTVGVPLVLSTLSGKAMEQSFLLQTEPSRGLDVFRSVLGYVQLAEMVIKIGIPAVTLVTRGVQKVQTWWRAKQALSGGLGGRLSTQALAGVRASAPLPQIERLSFGGLSNGARESLARSTGRLSSVAATASESSSRLSTLGSRLSLLTEVAR